MRIPALLGLPVLTAVCLVAVAVHAAWPAEPASTPTLPEPVVTHENLFTIPFHVEKADQPSREPVEVQLFVSVNRGANWIPYSQVDPAQGRFMVRAVADGEYWFMVRTLDRGGKLRPELSSTPEMRVIVDTAYAISNPAPQTSRTAGFTPTEQPRMVNSRMFELVYDNEPPAATPARRLELWGTCDGGQNWRRYAVSDDSRKPMLVNVEGEGTYGFRAVRNATGQDNLAPNAADKPEIWIGVDMTKPAVRNLSAKEGTGAEAGSLVISWEASDTVLAARPVSLMFSDTPGGPWNTIVAGLENTGRYCWSITSRLPRQVYLRMEVRDEANNVGTCESQEPAVLAGFYPSVHISDVRSSNRPASAEVQRSIMR
jgi:hypothetical protein